MALKVHLRIDLPRVMTGAEIAALVRKVAGQEYFQAIDLVDDGGTHYEIGVNSEKDFRDLVIAVGEPSHQMLRFEQSYQRIYVVYKKRKNADKVANYGEQDIIEAMKAFHAQLQNEFKSLQSLEGTGGQKIIFDWRGQSYQAGMLASVLNLIVLPDGTVLEAGMWTDSQPPQPDAFSEISNPYKGKRIPEEIAGEFGGVVAEPVES